MTPLFIAVLTASLVGSPHCAGMCGPLAVLASARHARVTVPVYHLARLIGYVCLGLIAGMAGATFELGGHLIGWQRAAATAAGALMIALGVAALVRLFRQTGLHFTLPGGMQRWLAAAHRRTATWSTPARSAAMGSMSIFLPCGWLYAFLITAAGLASPWGGAAVMAVFWMGTVPALMGVTWGARTLSGTWRQYVPHATAILLIAVGAYTMFWRATTTYAVLEPSHATESLDEQQARVEALPHTSLPCCDPQ